jgi:hypothetical protein
MFYVTGTNAKFVFDVLFSVFIVFHFNVFFRLSLKKLQKYEKSLIITEYIQILVDLTNFRSVLCTSPVEKLSLNNSST